MTGYTVHTGSNDNFSNGWDRIFGGADEPTKPAKPKPAKRTAKAAKSKGVKSKARPKR